MEKRGQRIDESGLFQESKSRLNFTGQPYSNESIFINSGFDHNFGDLEESVIDRFAIEIPMTVKPKDVSVRIFRDNLISR
jgi:hypothetical protein